MADMAALWSLYQNFRFVPGYTPVSDLRSVIIASGSYIVAVYALQALMTLRKEPFKLKWLSVVHDIFLSLGSAVVLVGILIELGRWIALHGWEAAWCDSHGTGIGVKGPLIFWYYIFYLSKIYEFIDTMLLVAKKKKLIFLHVYHHFITLMVVWASMAAQTPITWIGIITNLGVHVVMYYYYALASLGIYSRWKRYITTIQIIQFIIDLLGVGLPLGWNLSHNWECRGEHWGLTFPGAVIGTFLVLFLNFYRATYNTKGKKSDHDD